ncbi:MAG: type IV pilin protein [Granulosicoccus sp.]
MNQCNNKRYHSGFTLIEVLIVVAILGIVAAIAIPSYSRYVINANRTDAISFLSEVAGEQQRYFSQNNAYANAMSDLGYGDQDTSLSPEGYYTVSIQTINNTRYILSATPVVGGRQAKDTKCNVFTLDSTGSRANTGGEDTDCW